MKTFNPYDKYASSSDITLGELVLEEWRCELVEPNHPVMRKRANLDPFGSNIDWASREAEMLDLMNDRLGIGLSANQVGSSYNMFVMRHSFLGEIGVYKPEILETKGEVEYEEGCLTWPLLYFKVTRPAEIKVKYLKNDGETVVETWMDGMDARCFLHEYDHLQGKVYLEYTSDLKLKRAKEKRDKLIKKLGRKINNKIVY